MRLKQWIVLWGALAACGESGGEPVDALVVVQETNLTACQLTNSYKRTVSRSCDGSEVSVAECTNAEDTFTATSTAACE